MNPSSDINPMKKSALLSSVSISQAGGFSAKEVHSLFKLPLQQLSVGLKLPHVPSGTPG